jgi:CBS domain-containing protein
MDLFAHELAGLRRSGLSFGLVSSSALFGSFFGHGAILEATVGHGCKWSIGPMAAPSSSAARRTPARLVRSGSEVNLPHRKEGAMAKKVRDLMSKDPIKVPTTAPIAEAARSMRTANVGAIVVEENGRPVGIVTDRDIAVRAVADGRDLERTTSSEICSKVLITVSPDDDLDRAIQVMRDRAIRRVVVMDPKNQVVGILSLGDLAMERDAKSVLGQISAAPPNQ